MATNQIHTGERVEVTPAEDVVSGQFLQVGDQIVVFVAESPAGESVNAMLAGHFDQAPKEAGVGLAWAPLETLYWDVANARFTTDDNAAANRAVAVAGAAAGDDDVLGEVILKNSVS